MSEEFNELGSGNGIIVTAVENQEQAAELVEKLFAVAQPSAVYGKPVVAEGHTVITASEVSVGMGFGYGIGSGSGGARRRQKESEDEPEDEGGETSVGGGGGGGGASMGRPVAAITISPNGVRVDPIVDVTKIALAFFTTIGSMFFMLSRMRKASQS
jgi:uncharacterized spore protein YtfJ